MKNGFIAMDIWSNFFKIEISTGNGMNGHITNTDALSARSTIIISMENQTSGGRFLTMGMTPYKRILILTAFQMSFAHINIGLSNN